MVLGTFAYCGSGQDTLADSFCQLYNFRKYSLGDIVRDIAKERNLPQTRDILATIRKECDKNYGREFFSQMLLKKIRMEYPEKVIITGIRTIEEYLLFKTELNMRLIFVFADEEIRYERMLRRKSEKDATTLEELQLKMARESEMFDYPELEQYADNKFDFNMPLEEFKNEEHKIVKNLLCELFERAGQIYG